MLDITERAQLIAERRDFQTFEFRDGGSDGMTFDGVASVVDTPYEVHDMFGSFSETIERGAFDKTLKDKADVRLLVNHDGVPLARTKANTLKLTAKPDLRAVASLDPANPRVQEIRSAMTRGDMDQMSIGFQVTRQEWNGDYTERYIREVKLFDVSVVTFPASTTTSASLRSLDEAIRSFKADDIDPDELRRAIAYLETLLPAEQAEERSEDPEELEAYFAELLRRRQYVA